MLVTHSHLTLCNPTDCSLPGSSVHGILQARKNTGVDNHSLRDVLVAQLVKNPPAMQETQVQLLGQEDPLEKGQAIHSSIPGLPWWLSW